MYTELKVRGVKSWFKFSKSLLKKTKKSNETDFLSVIFINEFHLKITDPTDFFPVKASLFHFLSGYYN